MSPYPILLLGGAGGIGRALHKELREAGQSVVIMDLAASLAAHPSDDPSIAVDLTDEASVTAAFEALDAIAPVLGGFVNLAGYNSKLQPLAQTEADYFDQILAGNLRGCYLAAKAAMPRIVQDGTGAVVNITSGLASHVRPGFGAYSASKAAVIAMTKTLALEHAPQVRVNAVAPSAVDTAFIRGGTGVSDEKGASVINIEAYTAMTPLRRFAQPKDVTGPIRFLLGPDSGFMTGQVLWVNGGGFMP